VSGFGLGVAKAAAAAALVGYAAAATAVREAGLPHRLTLLLASAGTHRSPLGDPAADVEPTGDQPTDDQPTGVEHYLGTHRRPDAAVVAKSGPAGVLYEEPGAMFLRIRIATELRPVLARDVTAPRGGLIAHLGTVIDLAEQWRTAHLRARPATGQIAAEVGIGAVRGGLPAKPDLLPGLVELHLYVVTLPGDDPQEIAAGLRHALRTGISGGPLADCTVTVDARLVHAAAATRPDARIVRHAVAAWQSLHRSPAPDISSWRGCTDGVVLRGQGIDTARLGPAARPDPADPRREVFALPDLVRFARIYADIALRHALDTQ
jgi:acetylornithine deacetylase/succinyl-diaminopimelate desuccinylase-like protein